MNLISDKKLRLFGATLTFSLLSLFLVPELKAASVSTISSSLEITSRVVAAEKGAASGGKTPFTITIQTRIKNNNSTELMTFEAIQTDLSLSGGTGGSFLTPISGGTVSASVSPTSGSITGNEVSSPTSATTRSISFNSASVTSISANSYVEVQFQVTLHFDTALAGTLNVLSSVAQSGSFYNGGLQADQEANLASLSSLTVVVDKGGGVTANFGTSGISYVCNDVNSSTTTCFVNNTYYGKPYITFTAATPDAGYQFDGWGDSCSASGSATTCTLRVTGDPIISARYSLIPYPTSSSVSNTTAYFGDLVYLTGTDMNSSSGWKIEYLGDPGTTSDNLIYRGTTFSALSTTRATFQLPTASQVETYSESFYGTDRSVTTGLSWKIHAFAEISGSDTYGGSEQDIVIKIASIPDSPTIGEATVTGTQTVDVSFTAPMDDGGRSIVSYTITVWNVALDTVIKTQTYSTGLPSLGSTATFSVTGLTAGTAYRFSVAATNSEGSSYQSYSTDALTTQSTSSGSGADSNSNSSFSDNSKNEQAEAERKRKEKMDQEIRELLGVVPSIAGLALTLSDFLKSFSSVQKCKNGKKIKKVRVGQKCPKGFSRIK